MVKAILNKLVSRNGDIGKQLASRRLTALETWSKLVQTAAAGGEVDIAVLEEAAVSLRIVDVPGEFSHDVDNVKARAEALASQARDEALAREAGERFTAASARIWQARQEVANLERDLAALPAYSAAVACSVAEVRRLEAETPRVFARTVLEERRMPSDPPVTQAEVEELALNMPKRKHSPEGYWDLTDGD